MNNILIIFDVLTVLIGLTIGYKSAKKTFHGNLSIMNICVLLFIIVQVFPIVIGWFGDVSKIKYYYKYMYLAMTDIKTGIFYDFFCILTLIIMYWLSNKENIKRINKITLKIKYNRNTSMVCIGLYALSIMVPVFAVLFAPNPFIYTKFSYFYTHSYSKIGLEYNYHSTIMLFCCYISLLSILVSYFFNSSKGKILYVVPIILLTWVNGKRTLLLFSIVGILIIDYLKNNFKNKREKKKYLRKILFCIIAFIIYYLIYNNITQKSEFANGYLLYATYFSRLSNVKISIYDRLYTKNMIDYPFETLLFNLIFFIPRAIIPNKPHPYFQHFTPYVFYGTGKLNNTISYAFQVNIWSEFITNAGIFLGCLLGIMFLYIISTVAEKSDSTLIYILGLLFIALYMLYGFEHVVQIVYVLFVVCSLLHTFKIGKKVK